MKVGDIVYHCGDECIVISIMSKTLIRVHNLVEDKVYGIHVGLLR